jgi:hypothetical protein
VGAGRNRVTHPRERTVVIRPRPTTQPRDGRLVTIEGLLVDLSIERRTLHLMGEGKYFRLVSILAFSHRPLAGLAG